MTKAELDGRARQRSIDERLHTFKVVGRPLYLVRSRHTEPGAMHEVRIDPQQRTIEHCTCKGWAYRASCTHSQAVLRRLEREGRKHEPAPVSIMAEASRGRSQLFRAEAGA
jgi:hypothetical protein